MNGSPKKLIIYEWVWVFCYVKVFPEVIYCIRGPINSTYNNFKSREDYF
jgi:hypothetical protein